VKANLDIVNDVTYKHAKFFVLWATQQLQNLIKVGDLKICILRSTCLSVLCSSEYKVFDINILHVCGIHHWLHPEQKMHFYLKLANMIFEFLK
jgi:hypothetical protein